jgi:hypothetical protein
LPLQSASRYTPARFAGTALRAARPDVRRIRPGGTCITQQRIAVPQERPVPPNPAPASTQPRPLTFLASGAGLIVAILCLPVVLLAGGPLNGWIVGVALWSANWGLQIFTAKIAINSTPTAAVGLSGISFISRAWLVAIILFVIALRYDESVGLTAAGVFLAAFTCDLVGRTMLFVMAQNARKDVPR